MKLTTSIVLATLFMAPAVQAGEFLSDDELKTLFTDKTFDGVYLPKDKHFSVYEAPDGTHNVVRSNGKKDKNRTWFIKDGKHCTTNPKWKKKPEWKDGRCSKVKDAGDGEYHKVSDDGEHTHTLTNFRDGNQL